VLPPSVTLEDVAEEQRRNHILYQQHIAAQREGLHNMGAPRDDAALSLNAGDFTDGFNALSSGLLEGLDWSHVLCAGGAPLAAVLGHTKPGDPLRPSDIDLFVHGCDTTEEATGVMLGIITTVKRNYAQATGDGEDIHVVVSAHAVTIFPGCSTTEGRLPIQIVLRSYGCPLEVLLGFDVDCCCVGFDGERPLFSGRAAVAITARRNVVDLTRRSPTYEKRLLKYVRRGFGVLVPGFDPQTVRQYKLSKLVKYGSMNSLPGMPRLLVAEADSRKGIIDAKREARALSATRRLFEVEDKAGGSERDMVEALMSDYGIVPAWHLLRRDELSRILGAGRSLFALPNGGSLQLMTVEQFLSKEPARLDALLTWTVTNPGSQGTAAQTEQVLLTSSFEPVAMDPTGWWRGDLWMRGCNPPPTLKVVLAEACAARGVGATPPTHMSHARAGKRFPMQHETLEMLIAACPKIGPYGARCSREALEFMAQLVDDMASRISIQARLLASSRGRRTLNMIEIQSAVRLILSGELAKHAVSEGTKAATKYTSSGDRFDRGEGSGLHLPPAIAMAWIRAHWPRNVGDGATVYLTAVCAYIIAELLELGGNVARDQARENASHDGTVDIWCLETAIMRDGELNKLFRGFLFPRMDRSHPTWGLPTSPSDSFWLDPAGNMVFAIPHIRTEAAAWTHLVLKEAVGLATIDGNQEEASSAVVVTSRHLQRAFLARGFWVPAPPRPPRSQPQSDSGSGAAATADDVDGSNSLISHTGVPKLLLAKAQALRSMMTSVADTSVADEDGRIRSLALYGLQGPGVDAFADTGDVLGAPEGEHAAVLELLAEASGGPHDVPYVLTKDAMWTVNCALRGAAHLLRQVTPKSQPEPLAAAVVEATAGALFGGWMQPLSAETLEQWKRGTARSRETLRPFSDMLSECVKNERAASEPARKQAIDSFVEGLHEEAANDWPDAQYLVAFQSGDQEQREDGGADTQGGSSIVAESDPQDGDIVSLVESSNRDTLCLALALDALGLRKLDMLNAGIFGNSWQFSRIIREVAQDFKTDLRFSGASLQLLHALFDMHFLHVFETAARIAQTQDHQEADEAALLQRFWSAVNTTLQIFPACIRG